MATVTLNAAVRSETGTGVARKLRQAGEVISGTPLVTDGGAVAFRFVFTGTPEQSVLDAWDADGMACAPLEGGGQMVAVRHGHGSGDIEGGQMHNRQQRVRGR